MKDWQWYKVPRFIHPSLDRFNHAKISLIDFAKDMKAFDASLFLPKCDFLSFLSFSSNGFLLGLSPGAPHDAGQTFSWHVVHTTSFHWPEPSVGYLYQVLFQEGTPLRYSKTAHASRSQLGAVLSSRGLLAMIFGCRNCRGGRC